MPFFYRENLSPHKISGSHDLSWPVPSAGVGFWVHTLLMWVEIIARKEPVGVASIVIHSWVSHRLWVIVHSWLAPISAWSRDECDHVATFSSNERKALFNCWDRGDTCCRAFFKQTFFNSSRTAIGWILSNMRIGWISSRRHLLTPFSRQFYSGRTISTK